MCSDDTPTWNKQCVFISQGHTRPEKNAFFWNIPQIELKILYYHHSYQNKQGFKLSKGIIYLLIHCGTISIVELLRVQYMYVCVCIYMYMYMYVYATLKYQRLKIMCLYLLSEAKDVGTLRNRHPSKQETISSLNMCKSCHLNRIQWLSQVIHWLSLHAKAVSKYIKRSVCWARF